MLEKFDINILMSSFKNQSHYDGCTKKIQMHKGKPGVQTGMPGIAVIGLQNVPLRVINYHASSRNAIRHTPLFSGRTAPVPGSG
jgi:hypothetical protein